MERYQEDRKRNSILIEDNNGNKIELPSKEQTRPINVEMPPGAKYA